MDSQQLLKGNEQIETAIEGLHQELSEEMLAHTLTVIRRRMKEGAHLIVSVGLDANTILSGGVPLTDPGEMNSQLSLKTIESDGKKWFVAYTSFEEQMKGNEAVQSGFTAEIYKLFQMTLATDSVEGLIINPWNKTIQMDKNLIQITMGQNN